MTFRADEDTARSWFSPKTARQCGRLRLTLLDDELAQRCVLRQQSLLRTNRTEPKPGSSCAISRRCRPRCCRSRRRPVRHKSGANSVAIPVHAKLVQYKSIWRADEEACAIMPNRSRALRKSGCDYGQTPDIPSRSHRTGRAYQLSQISFVEFCLASARVSSKGASGRGNVADPGRPTGACPILPGHRHQSQCPADSLFRLRD